MSNVLFFLPPPPAESEGRPDSAGATQALWIQGLEERLALSSLFGLTTHTPPRSWLHRTSTLSVFCRHSLGPSLLSRDFLLLCGCSKKQRLKTVGSSSAPPLTDSSPRLVKCIVLARKEGEIGGVAPFPGSPHRSPSYCKLITLSVSIKAQQPMDKLALFYRTLWYSSRAWGREEEHCASCCHCGE